MWKALVEMDGFVLVILAFLLSLCLNHFVSCWRDVRCADAGLTQDKLTGGWVRPDTVKIEKDK